VAVSGSGALRHTPRANTLAVTSDATSPLARAATIVWHIPAATKYARAGTVQPLSSLFDQCTHIVLDAACLKIVRARDVSHAAALAAHV
jgi:6-phospho-3-hexuloisomerase